MTVKDVCVCVNLQEVGAVLLQEKVGEILKDWLTVQGHKLFTTDLEEVAHTKMLWIHLVQKDDVSAEDHSDLREHKFSRL